MRAMSLDPSAERRPVLHLSEGVVGLVELPQTDQELDGANQALGALRGIRSGLRRGPPERGERLGGLGVHPEDGRLRLQGLDATQPRGHPAREMPERVPQGVIVPEGEERPLLSREHVGGRPPGLGGDEMVEPFPHRLGTSAPGVVARQLKVTPSLIGGTDASDELLADDLDHVDPSVRGPLDDPQLDELREAGGLERRGLEQEQMGQRLPGERQGSERP